MWSWLRQQLFSSYVLRNKQKPVRFAFPIVAVTTLFFGLAAVTAKDGSYISIITSQNSVKEGDTFFIEVKAYAHVPVNAIDIVVDYPERQMTVEGVDTGTSVITLWTEDPYARGGKVYLRGGVFQKGFLGEHTIARIRGEAIESGVAQVSLDSASLIAGDGKGTEVKTAKVAANETRIYVENAEGALKGRASLQIITDVDGNGVVDFADTAAFMAAWFTKSRTFDFNGDGKMTFRDFSILLADSFFK